MREFDFRAIMRQLVAGWHTPAAFVVAALLYTLYTLHSAPTIYRVQMLVLPAPADRMEGGGGTSATASAIGSLLGISNGAQAGSDYVRYQRLLSSPAVAQRMQDKYGMLQYVFASSWDGKNKRWVAPSTTRGFLLGWLFDLAHVPMWSPPDATVLADYIQGKVLIMPSATTDIVAVSMESPKVEFAKRVMLVAHEQANALLRDQIARRAKQQVDYLETKLAQTAVADYRATLLALLSSQEKTLMLTQTDASFAAEIVSPPVASPTPVSPRPVLSVAVAVLVGVLVGAVVVIFFGPGWWRYPFGKISEAIAAVRGRSIETRATRRA